MRAVKVFLFAMCVNFGAALQLYALPTGFDDEFRRYLDAKECVGEQSQWRYCKSTVQLDEDAIYVGNFLNGLPHGWGVRKNLNADAKTEGLWYKGDLIWAQMESPDLQITSAISKKSGMLGFTEIKDFSGAQPRFTYSHINGTTTYGNIVSEVHNSKDLWDSAFIGPGDGTKPFGIGFLFIKGIGVKWCSLNTNELPCGNSGYSNTAIRSLKQSFNSLSRNQRETIQKLLSKLWYYNSTIDGAWGQNTQFAILKYFALHTDMTLSPNLVITPDELWTRFDPNSFTYFQYGSIDKLANYGFQPSTNTFGTGFIFNADGAVLTNEHVVRDCNEISFFVDGKQTPASVAAANQLADLAVLTTNLSINEFLNFKIENSEPSLMDKIFAVGFPYGGELTSEITVTSGIISAETVGPIGLQKFQIDAAIQPGNSGGPIINESGDLVGIATSKADTSYFLEKYGSIPENMAFAIDLQSVVLFLAGHGFKASDNPNTSQMPKLKNIVGRISCTQNEAVEIREIHKARLKALAEQ